MNALVPQDAVQQQTAAQAPARTYQEKTLSELVQMAEDAEEASDQARKSSEKCRDYYDHKQLDKRESAILAQRGQPDVIINRIFGKVNFLLGYEATTRTDPRGRPRTPQDEDAAEACTDALNYVRDKSDQKASFSQVWENLLIEGYGAVELIPALKEGDADIQIKRWHWDRLFYDPHSREHDFSDAQYLGGYVWMDLKSARNKWRQPETPNAFEQTVSSEWSNTYEDRPAWKTWLSGPNDRRRIRIAQMYYLCPAEDGSEDEVWHWAHFTRGGFLARGVVPYRTQDGKSWCPMIMQSAFVDRENRRYGYIKAMISPQDEINKRRSKLLHEINMRQFVYADGELDDVDITKRELAKPDGAVKVNPVGETPTFQLLDRSKEIAGHSALQTEAKQEIDLMGPNAAMFGTVEGGSSGRAMLVGQQGGQIEIGVLLDRHNHFKRRVHEGVWSLIQTYWTASKWVRVTDNEDNIRFVGFNRPVLMAEELLKQAVEQGVPEDQAKSLLAERAQDPDERARLETPVRTENVPAEMGMDIILEEIPDTANIQQEQFALLVELAQSGQVPIPPDVLIMASSLRNKRELLKRVEESMQNPAAQQAAQIQVEQAALDFEKGKADIQKILAQVEQIKADIIETLAKADTYDLSVGTVTDPAIVKSTGQTTPTQPQQTQAAPAA